MPSDSIHAFGKHELIQSSLYRAISAMPASFPGFLPLIIFPTPHRLGSCQEIFASDRIALDGDRLFRPADVFSSPSGVLKTSR